MLAEVDKAVAPFAPGPVEEGQGEEEELRATADAAVGTTMKRATPDHDVEMGNADVGVAVSREEIMASIERADTPTTTASTIPAGQTHPRSISLPTNPLPARLKTLADAKSHRGGAKTAPSSKEPSATPALSRPSKKPKLSRQDNEDDDEDLTDYFAKKNTLVKKTSSTPHLQSSEKRSKPTPTPQPTSKESSTNPDRSDRPKKKKTPGVGGKTVKAGDEFDDIFGALDSKKKKTQDGVSLGGRTVKAGDEFDDIFGSLDSKKKKGKTTTTKPKKRRKGGDEFDDIFGGL